MFTRAAIYLQTDRTETERKRGQRKTKFLSTGFQPRQAGTDL